MYQDDNDKTAGNSSKVTLIVIFLQPTQLLKPPSAEPTLKVIFSNPHLLPNLDTAWMFFHCCGLSTGDMTKEGERSDLQFEIFIVSMKISGADQSKFEVGTQ